MNRVKILSVSPELLIGFGQRGCPKCVVVDNPLPADARIMGAGMIPRLGTAVVQHGIADLLFRIESDTFPDVRLGREPELAPLTIRDDCPHRVAANFPIPGVSPYAISLTRDDLAALLYDADRQPGRRLTLDVRPDGTWEAKA